jgi:putative endonuclease
MAEMFPAAGAWALNQRGLRVETVFRRKGACAMPWLAQKRIGWMESALTRLDAVARRRGFSLPAHLATGLEGEDAANFYLRRKGYIIVARRWSAGNLPGDLDLIAWQGERLCFIEVKTRTARDASPAEIAVDAHKRTLLRRLARQYMRQLPQAEPRLHPVPARFDVISVYLVPGEPREFLHFENAFGWNEQREERGRFI